MVLCSGEDETTHHIKRKYFELHPSKLSHCLPFKCHLQLWSPRALQLDPLHVDWRIRMEWSLAVYGIFQLS